MFAASLVLIGIAASRCLQELVFVAVRTGPARIRINRDLKVIKKAGTKNNVGVEGVTALAVKQS